MSALVWSAGLAGAAVETLPGPPSLEPVSHVGGPEGVAQGGGLCDSSGVEQFGDVSADDYGAAYILCMRALGLSLGTGAGDYGPDSALTRGQMASFLVRLWRDVLGMGCPSGGTPFTDVTGGVHAGNIACLYNLEITKGKTASTYEPGSDLTAGQISRFLFRTYEKAGGLCEDRDSELDEAVTCLEALRVLPSAEEGRSDRPVTRAQMAVYVIGLWHHLAGRGVPPDPPPLATGLDPDSQESEVVAGLIGNPIRALAPQFPPTSHRTEGERQVTVYFCVPEGKYSTDDLRALVDRLNKEVGGFFGRLSSGRLDLKFVAGAVFSSVIEEGLGLHDLWEGAVLPCRDAVFAGQPVRDVLIITDVATDETWGYGCTNGNPGVVATPDRYESDRAFLSAVAGTVGRSTLGLRLLVTIHQERELGTKLPHLRSLFYQTPIEPVLTCFQYEQLGWPVPGFAQPCERLSPSSPRSLAISQADDYSLSLRWEPPLFSDNVPIDGYTLSFTNTAGVTLETYYKGPDEHQHVFDGILKVEGRYRFKVLAHSRYGEGDDTGISVSIPPLPPPPDPITISKATDTFVELSWRAWDLENENTYVNLGYEVRYTVDGTTSTNDASSNGIARLSGLDPGTEYTVDVRSCSRHPSPGIDRLCGDWTTITVSTQSVLPPPGSVSVEAGHNWYLLTWEPVPGVSKYQVELPDGAWTTSSTPDYGTRRGVEPDTTYSAKVRSCNLEYGFCEWGTWTTATFTTSSQPSIPPPYRVVVHETGDSWVSLLWDSIGGAGGGHYDIEYEYTDGVTSSGLVQDWTRPGTPLRIATEPSNDYTFKIRNCDDPLTCSRWTSITFSTDPTTRTSDLAQPSASTSSVGDIWIGLSWNAVPGALSYDVEYGVANSDDPQPAAGGTRTSFELHFAEPNTTYTFRIRACGQATEPCSEWTTLDVTTLGSIPAAPPSYPLSVTEVTDTSVHLSWNPPDRHATYELRWYADQDRLQGRPCCLNYYTTPQDRPRGIIWNLKANTAYTLNARVCSRSTNTPCGNWVTIKVTTRA